MNKVTNDDDDNNYYYFNRRRQLLRVVKILSLSSVRLFFAERTSLRRHNNRFLHRSFQQHNSGL